MAIRGKKISHVRIKLRELVDSDIFINFWELVIIAKESVNQYVIKENLEQAFDYIKHEIDYMRTKEQRLTYLLKYINLSNKMLLDEVSKGNKIVIKFSDLINEFINEIKLLYTVNKDLSQEELITEIDKKKEGISSNDQFEYFNFLLFENGIEKIRESFLIDEYKGQADLLIDKINDFKIYSSYVDGEYESKVVKFIDCFEKDLNVELLNLKDSIRQKIYSCKTKSERVDYLQVISIDLKKLYYKKNVTVNKRYLEKVKTKLLKVAECLFEDFADYIGKSKTDLAAIIQNEFNQNKIVKNRGIYALNLICNDENDIINTTFDFLKNKYIPNDSKELYRNIFIGEIELKRLTKIIWLPKHGINLHKLKLIHFFDSLIQKKLLDEDETSLKIKLPLLFCDTNGDSIAHIQESYSSYSSDYDKDPKMNDFLAGL